MNRYEMWLRSNKETRDVISKAIMGLFPVMLCVILLFNLPRP